MTDDSAFLRGAAERPRGPAGRCGQAPTDRLAQAIEGQIIPRLMLAHRIAADPVCPDDGSGPARPDSSDVVQLAELVLRRDTAAGLALVESLLDSGVGLEAVYLELLAPAARYLGELWDSDAADFVQVTLGLCRLQQVVHALAPAVAGAGGPAGAFRALLCALPGEQHTFGLTIVGDFLRRAGWNVEECRGAHQVELEAAVASESFDLIGFSVGCETRLDRVATTISVLRRASRNRGAVVMVGGHAFAAHPERAVQVGADAMAQDGRQAAALARELVAGRVSATTS